MTKMNAMTFRFPLPAIALLFLPALPVAAEAQAQTKSNISLLEYGARFDGVTDDTEAWKRAINDALSGPWGAVIKVPAGRSVVSETLVLEITGNEGLAINGEGADISEIIWTKPMDGIRVELADGSASTRDEGGTGAKFKMSGVSLIQGTPFVRVETTEPVPAGSTQLHLATTKGLSPGMHIDSFCQRMSNIPQTATIARIIDDKTVELTEKTTGPMPERVRSSEELSTVDKALYEIVFVQYAGTALSVRGRSNQQLGVEPPELMISDVSIHGGSGGSALTAGSCWRDGMVFKDQTTLRITDTAIRFSRVSPIGTGITISGDRSKHRLVSDHHLENVRIQWGEVGISVCNGDPNFEALMIMNSTIVGSRRAGILADNGGSYSGQLTVTGCHINAGGAAIKTNGILEVGLCNNYIIVGQIQSPDAMAHGFHFKNSASMTVTGNLFNFVAGNRAKESWGMLVDCDESWEGRKIPSVIANNSIFNAPTGGLSFRNHATNILVNGNSIVTAGKPIEAAETAKANVGINQINDKMTNGLE
jgi:hypothetical protein